MELNILQPESPASGYPFAANIMQVETSRRSNL